MARQSKLQPPVRSASSLLILLLLQWIWNPLLLNAEPTQVPVAPEETTSQMELEEDDLREGPQVESATGTIRHSSTAEEGHCAWGTACHPDYVAEGGTASPDEEETKTAASSAGNASSSSSSNNNNSNNNMSHTTLNGVNIPFVHHHHNHPNSQGKVVPPPEGFTIVARVYTDPNDKLAHFTDDEEGSHITLPYWECGATGSTTSPLPVKHAYFRHSLSGAKPQVWSGTEYGPHPQLVVALKRMEMTLNSGETKQLKAGDVVLLEDVVSGGHKLKALEGFDMTYLLLTLPQHYHHVGRDQMALKRGSMEKKQQDPCPNENPQQQQGEQGQSSTTGGSAFVNRQQIPKLSSKSWENFLTGGNIPEGEVAPLREPKLRKLILGVFGLSVSTLIADFLGKVAPLWLAVGIGGTCFVVGGTFGIVQGGDYICSEIEMWQERRRLAVVDDAEPDNNNNMMKDQDEPQVDKSTHTTTTTKDKVTA